MSLLFVANLNISHSDISSCLILAVIILYETLGLPAHTMFITVYLKKKRGISHHTVQRNSQRTVKATHMII